MCSRFTFIAGPVVCLPSTHHFLSVTKFKKRANILLLSNILSTHFFLSSLRFFNFRNKALENLGERIWRRVNKVQTCSSLWPQNSFRENWIHKIVIIFVWYQQHIILCQISTVSCFMVVDAVYSKVSSSLLFLVTFNVFTGSNLCSLFLFNSVQLYAAFASFLPTSITLFESNCVFIGQNLITTTL